MRKLAFVLALILVAVSLLAVGCGEEEESSPTPTPTPEPTASPMETPTATPEPTPTPTQQVDEALLELLALAGDIESVSYEYVASYAGMTIPTKVWIKGNKMRTEATVPGMGETISIIDFDAGTMTTLVAGQPMSVPIGSAPASPTATATSIADYGPAVVGTETIDGKECTVVEYTAGEDTATVWIWQQNGFIVKMEMPTPEGPMTLEYKNIDFSPIDDSMFELP